MNERINDFCGTEECKVILVKPRKVNFDDDDEDDD